MPRFATLNCVLFDLDGTLVDTAPDLTRALNRALGEEGFAPVTLQVIKPIISQGASAMVRYGLGPDFDEPLHARVLNHMLEDYRVHIADATDLYHGMEDVLDELERRNLKWGVVTNKHARFTEPLLQALGLVQRAACIISGDTTANSKPHPDPMFAACERTGTRPAECIYVGDSAKDIEAGRRAGMRTLAALYGYLPADEDARQWGADAFLNAPAELLRWLDADA
ncbi:MAG: phosphoglycolate phosphatase [Pseudomonadota bacterium]